MRYLYMKSGEDIAAHSEISDFLAGCRVEQHAPTPLHLSRHGERLSVKTAMGRLSFWLMTAGKFRICYLYSGDDIVHTVYVVPKCRKFPFLQPGDYEIGPCVTNEHYRNRGSYQYMLRYITASDAFSGGVFYMIVRGDNHASVRGIEKAGFTRCGTVVRSRFLHSYKKER